MRTYVANGDMAANTNHDFLGGAHNNKFTDFVADGFTIQNHNQVNTNAETYYCIIIKEVNGIVNSGTYVGNATDDRSIAVTGFAGITGDCAWTYAGGRHGNMLTTGMGADNTCLMIDGVATADRIQALEAGGFQIGAANACNENGITFYFSEFKDYAAAGVEVTAGLDSLIITEYNPTVNAEVSFTAGLDALVITEYAADVNLNVNVIAGLDTLVITEYAATVKVDTGITVGLDTLVITEYTAVVNAEVSFMAGLDALVITEYNAVIDFDLMIAAGFDPLILTEYNPAVAFGLVGLNRRGSSGLGFSFRDGWR